MSAQQDESAFAAGRVDRDPDAYNQLGVVYEQMKENVEHLKTKIAHTEKTKKKIMNKIEHTVVRHKRVTERLEKRKLQATEYRKTIEAVDAGYNQLLESSTTLLSVLQTQVNMSKQKEVPKATPDM